MREQDRDKIKRPSAGGLMDKLEELFSTRPAAPPRQEKRQVKEVIDRSSAAPEAMPEKQPASKDRRQFETFVVFLTAGEGARVEAAAPPDYWIVFSDNPSALTLNRGVLCMPGDAPVVDYSAGATSGPTTIMPGAGAKLNGNATLRIPGRGRYLSLLPTAAPANQVIWVWACTNVDADRSS